MERIDAKRWIAAWDASEWERDQIQGFYYHSGEPEGYHVIRDLRKPAGAQKVWELWSNEATYGDGHTAMLAQIRLMQTQIACDFYRDGWPELDAVAEAAQ